MSITSSMPRARARSISFASMPLAFFAQLAFADILPNQPTVDFQFGGQAYSVQRQSGAALPETYRQPSTQCPPNCVEPAVAAAGVATLTELEVFAFMQNEVNAGSGLLVDARLPENYAQGSIPGAISVPGATLIASNPYREDLLLALGATGTIGSMDFSGAFDLLIFDDGPWSPVARDAIERLIQAGYPPSKLRYYRGGLQLWHIFGLTVSR